MEVLGRTSDSDIFVLGSNDANEDFYCDPCENDGEMQPADGFCEDCQEYLCSSCFKIHRSPLLWRHHVLLDKDAMPKTKTKLELNYECTEPCVEHLLKIIEYFCRTHDQLGCPVCITGNHRTCNDVDYIPHIAKRYRESSEIKGLFNSLESLQEETYEYTVTANEELLKIAENEKNANARVLQHTDEFNSLCDRLKEDIDSVKRSDERKIKYSIRKYKEISRKTKTRVAVLEKIRAEMKMSQLFTEAKLSKLSVINLAKELELVKENVQIRHYDIDFNVEALRNGLKLNFIYDEMDTEELERFNPSGHQNTPTDDTHRHVTATGDESEAHGNKSSGKLDDRTVRSKETAKISRLMENSNKLNVKALHNEEKKPLEAAPANMKGVSPLQASGKVRYDREFLLRFRDCVYAQQKPSNLPDIPDFNLDKTRPFQILDRELKAPFPFPILILSSSSELLTTLQRSCKDIYSIPDAIETLFRKSDIAKTYQDVQGMKSVLESITKLRRKLLKELNESRNKAINTIKEFNAEMECILERLERESIEEVEKEFRKLESGLNEEVKKAEYELDSLKVTADDFRKSEGNNAQQFVSMKNAEKALSHAGENSCSLAAPTGAEINFSVSTEIRDFLYELKSFGSVRNIAQSNPKRETVYSIKSTRDLNIKLQNDTSDCYVHGLCLTADDKLLLSDYYNKKPKRVDIVNTSVEDYCDLPSWSYSVCCTSKQEAAVCLSTSSIQFVSLGNQMTCTRQIKLGHFCYGMVYKDDMLYITDNTQSLYKYDIAGNLLLKMQNNSVGNNLFQYNRHVTLSEFDDRMYVTDHYQGLVTLDSQGNHVDTFTDTGLTNAVGVCTDSRGNVFVCGYNSHNVIQIAEDGKRKRGFVLQNSDGIFHPIAICFDRRRCMLFITQATNSTIKLFELQ